MVAWYFLLIAAVIGLIAGMLWYAVYAMIRFEKMRYDFEVQSGKLVQQMDEAVWEEREKLERIKVRIKEGALAGGSPEKGRHQLVILEEIIKEVKDEDRSKDC